MAPPEDRSTYLNDGQLRVPRHRAREVVRRVPKHTVPDLVHLPRTDERNVARDRRLQHELAAVELAGLFLVPRNRHAGFHAALLQADRDRALFHCSGRARRSVERGEARGVGVQPADERPLGNQLQRDLAVQV